MSDPFRSFRRSNGHVGGLLNAHGQPVGEGSTRKLGMNMQTEGGVVRIDFGGETPAWFAMRPDQARAFATALLEFAGKAEGGIETPHTRIVLP